MRLFPKLCSQTSSKSISGYFPSFFGDFVGGGIGLSLFLETLKPLFVKDGLGVEGENTNEDLAPGGGPQLIVVESSVVPVRAGGDSLGGVVHPDVLVLLDSGNAGVVREPVVDQVGALDAVNLDQVEEGNESENLGEAVEGTVHESAVSAETEVKGPEEEGDGVGGEHESSSLSPGGGFLGVDSPGLVENTGASNISGVTSSISFDLALEPVKGEARVGSEKHGNAEANTVKHLDGRAGFLFFDSIDIVNNNLLFGISNGTVFKKGVTGHSSDIK